ncbi:MAG: hypothetical protein ACM3NQ_13730 [Bacteroidales bacterium]
MIRALAFILAVALCVTAAPLAAPRVESPLMLVTSDARLGDAFLWARRQAMAYAFEGDPVGDWYEAALPGREAFCMRDVSHQAMGAHVLGLAKHTHNMLRRFAENVTDSRDWCSLWEIDRHAQPAHADYRNDHDFWYNLPANFDVLDTAYRMYLWTGDRDYLDGEVFRRFYSRTVTDYVERWGLGLGAIMKRPRFMNRKAEPDPDAKFNQARGIPGYNEENDDFVVGFDLLATQYAGYAAYGRILEARGDGQGARTWLKNAADVRALVNTSWWDPNGGFYDRLTSAYKLVPRSSTFWNIAELYWPVADGPHTKVALERLMAQIKKSRSAPIEEQSHHPEVLYRYGAAEVAYDQIMDLSRPDRARREYPEVSFSVIGAIANGLMGISVDPVTPGREDQLLEYFAGQFVTTLPALTAQTPWAELQHVPVRANDITVRHEGQATTIFTNNSGPAIVWRAAFPGRFTTLLVDGKPMKAATQARPEGRDISFVRVVVAPGVRVKVEAR